MLQKATAVVQQLGDRNWTISLAESCTGGMLAETITSVSGASNVFECGVVSYSCRIKSEFLGVDPELIEQYTVVSEPVSVAMATGIRERAKANLGVGITGVAGPGPDGVHPEGEIFVSLSDGVHSFTTHLNTGTTNQREQNRKAAVEAALDLVLEYLEGNQ